ncbi:MAG: histidine phosphatase family protein [Candidatus Eremiobacteraeota bacterium]|nr:histidine phosphatase family protein [Candidatus Eremiobacteraeota bacterium]MBV8375205.1 histidine phosphatase family protein [Candidatus Eremiobacteraeota bacterium]
MQLTLVRHGATRWNAERRFQGSADVPLNAEGLAQAAALARRLAQEQPDRIYSSDLQRALKTAELIAAPHGLRVNADARLREFAFGSWEGLTWPEILALTPGLGANAWRDPSRYEPPGGERFEDVCARIASFYNDLARAGVGRAIVVTHAGVLHATLRVLQLMRGDTMGGADVDLHFRPAGITRVAIERGAGRLATLDDVQHLQ